MKKPFRIHYSTRYNGPLYSDLVIEAESQIMARFVFSELYRHMKFRKAIHPLYQ